MYEERFGLNRKPFQSVLTNVDFYQSTAYKGLSDSILHALRSDLGVAVLTGPSGIGKTVTLDSFRRTLDRDGQAMVLRGGTIQTASDLLHSLHRRLIPPPGKPTASRDASGSQNLERWEVLERMQRIADFWGPTIILLDDAHLAGIEVFSELRTLLEEEADGHRLVRLLISGPISLEETLALPAMVDFAQRIRAHEFMQPFTSTESVAYLEHQIRRVGGDINQVFEPKAIERIVAAADGVPRCIDLLADESLMAANKAEASVVSVKNVDDALKRLRHLPHSWNVSLFASDEEEPDLEDDEFEPRKTAKAVQTKAAQPSTFVDSARASAFSASASATTSGTGFIEIGASAVIDAGATHVSSIMSSTETTASVLETSTTSDSVGRVQMSAPGVIEIGADTKQAATMPSAASAVVEIGNVADDAASSESDIQDDIGVEVTEEEFFAADDSDSPSSPSATPDGSAPKPVDFDRVFGAVSIAGGVVAVTQNVIGEGRLPKANANANLTANVTGNVTGKAPSVQPKVLEPSAAAQTAERCSLEHHMVLAHRTDDKTDDNIEAESVSEEAAIAVLEAKPEVGQASANAVPAVDRFTPWQPPGSWNAAPQAAKSLFQSVSRVNSSPVFDRYTWCELGRSVTAEPAKRIQTIATYSEESVWPPIVDGIAPATHIPMLPFDEDFSELLSDLGILVDSTNSTLYERSQSNSGVANTGEQFRGAPVDLRTSTVNPDQWIDHIDQLIDSDDASSETEIQATESVNTPPASQQRLFTLPIDLQDVDLSPPLPFSNGDSGQSRSDSDSKDAQAELQQVQHVDESMQVLECGDVQQDVVDSENQQVYAPRLLAQARSRIVTMGTVAGGLKLAAGAESMSAVDEAVATSPQLGLHVSGSDETNAQTSESGGSFSNLFTRLRQLRKR